MTDQSQTVAIPEQGVISVDVAPAGLTEWQRATQGADYVAGHDLAKEEDLDDLTGWEQAISRIVFRPGIIREIEKGHKKQFAYASLESMLSPVQNLRRINRRRKASELEPRDSMDAFAFEPGEYIVYNDGSTGIYRQVVEYLASKGRIVLPEPIVTGGEMGESSFDLPPGDWTSYTADEADYTDESAYAIAFNVNLHLGGGLRRSVYPDPTDPSGKRKSVTRYIG